jgi:hypothetical protein
LQHVINITQSAGKYHVQYRDRSLGLMDSPIREVAKALLAAGASPDDTITASWPDGPNVVPVPLASFTRHRPAPHNFAAPAHRR